MDYMDIAVPRKAVKLTHSLTRARTHALTHSLTHLLTLTHSLTHSGPMTKIITLTKQQWLQRNTYELADHVVIETVVLLVRTYICFNVIDP